MYSFPQKVTRWMKQTFEPDTRDFSQEFLLLNNNTINYITASFSIGIGTVLFFLIHSQMILWPSWIEGILFILLAQLNRTKHKYIAALGAFLLHSSAVVYFGLLFGQAVDAPLMGIFIVGLPLLSFKEKKTLIGCISFSCLSILIVVFNRQYQFYPSITVPTKVQFPLEILSIFAMMFLNGMLLYKFTSHIRMLIARQEKISNNKSNHIRASGHAFRNRMYPISTIAQMLKANLFSPDELEKMKNNLYSASREITVFIDNALQFESLGNGEPEEINNESFSIQDWMNEEVAHAQYKASEKGITLRLVIDKGTPEYIIADKRKLGQIVTNLLYNAIKFSRKYQYIHVKIKIENQTLYLSVQDYGKGISKENLNKIFQPFVTERNQHTPSTGLGLTLTDILTKQLGGSIEVVSEEGKGALFSVSIPVTVEQQQPCLLSDHEEEPKDVLRNFEGTRVLMIEDEIMAGYVMETFLKKLNCAVEKAENLDEALNLLSTKKIHVIMTDLTLPDAEGVPLIQRLQFAAGDAIPIIILTADKFNVHSKVSVETYKKLGVAEILSKPVMLNHVRQALSKNIAIIMV